MSGYSAPPGGSVAQTVVRRDFEVTFDTAGLGTTPLELFTPEVDETVIMAWVKLNELWDGDTEDETTVAFEVGMLSAEKTLMGSVTVGTVGGSLVGDESHGFSSVSQLQGTSTNGTGGIVRVAHPIEVKLYLKDTVTGEPSEDPFTPTQGSLNVVFITVPSTA